MRQLVFECKAPCNETLGVGVQAYYDGLTLYIGTTIEDMYLQTAITAHQGETIVITVCERMIVCQIKGGIK